MTFLFGDEFSDTTPKILFMKEKKKALKNKFLKLKTFLYERYC